MSDRLHRLLDAATQQRPLPAGEPPVTPAELDHLQALLGELAGHTWDRDLLTQALAPIQPNPPLAWRHEQASVEGPVPRWLERAYRVVFRPNRTPPLPTVATLSPTRWVVQARWARRLTAIVQPVAWLTAMGSLAFGWAGFARAINLVALVKGVAARGQDHQLLGQDLNHLTPLGAQLVAKMHLAESWIGLGLTGIFVSAVLIGLGQELARRSRRLSPGAVTPAAQALWDKSTRVQAYLAERMCPMPLTQEEVGQLTHVAEAELTQAPAYRWVPLPLS